MQLCDACKEFYLVWNSELTSMLAFEHVVSLFLFPGTKILSLMQCGDTRIAFVPTLYQVKENLSKTTVPFKLQFPTKMTLLIFSFFKTNTGQLKS